MYTEEIIDLAVFAQKSKENVLLKRFTCLRGWEETFQARRKNTKSPTRRPKRERNEIRKRIISYYQYF